MTSLVGALLLCLPLAGETQDRPVRALETRTPQHIELAKGKSLVIDAPILLKRVSLADPEIADALVISPRQLYLTGKAVGTTNLTLWEENGRVFAMYDLVVSLDLSRLKEQFHEILPREDIRVTATHDVITLFGNISSTAKLAQALDVAHAFAPKKVVNLLQVAGVHQVMLEVRVAEISRSVTKRLGFNFTVQSGGTAFGVSQVNRLTTFDDFVTEIGAAINALFRIQTGAITLTSFIDALKEHGLVKILAKPTLVTLSGQEAHFLAGGEFPVPVPQRENTVTIEFKTFGVGLSFTPTVLSDQQISLRVAPEVSELDFANAVSFSGFVVPALTTRRASTVIELADGQSFAIAGLLDESVRESISKFPLLGDLPILGALFRSVSFQKSETELVILVTPHLVKPVNLAQQPLPTDAFSEPNNVELLLLGKLEGSASQGEAARKLDGEFGYSMP
ncbi:MAG TPA: type II and III secretion system protein family protein [Candidatus Tectomicrobia bacterium]